MAATLAFVQCRAASSAATPQPLAPEPFSMPKMLNRSFRSPLFGGRTIGWRLRLGDFVPVCSAARIAAGRRRQDGRHHEHRTCCAAPSGRLAAASLPASLRRARRRYGRLGRGRHGTAGSIRLSWLFCGAGGTTLSVGGLSATILRRTPTIVLPVKHHAGVVKVYITPSLQLPLMKLLQTWMSVPMASMAE